MARLTQLVAPGNEAGDGGLYAVVKRASNSFSDTRMELWLVSAVTRQSSTKESINERLVDEGLAVWDNLCEDPEITESRQRFKVANLSKLVKSLKCKCDVDKTSMQQGKAASAIPGTCARRSALRRGDLRCACPV